MSHVCAPCLFKNYRCGVDAELFIGADVPLVSTSNFLGISLSYLAGGEPGKAVGRQTHRAAGRG